MRKDPTEVGTLYAVKSRHPIVIQLKSDFTDDVKIKAMRIILCKGQIRGPISGSDETLVTYASQLQKAGHEVSVLLMYLHAEEDQYY